jgi:transcriptional regulator with XRE-family HTH domain
MTNDEFGDKVGCDFTMASRLKNGQRLPSRELLERIVEAYDLDANEALAATRAGRAAFKEYLRANVFEASTRTDP